MYYQPETDRVFGLHSEIRAALPHVMFGTSIGEDDLEFVGIFPLHGVAPEVEAGQIAEPLAVDLVDGQWTQLWTVRYMTPEELEAARPSVPQTITIGQGKEALYNAGLFEDVQTAVAAIEDPDTKWRVQNAWNNRPTWERQSPFVLMMADILGLTLEEADQLFIDAAKL